jgi:hypothetical protein
VNQILKTEHAARTVGRQWLDPTTLPGLLVTMRDGSVWFHPYDGSKPQQEKPS